MNINQIRYVKAVAETGSFTLAAEQCHVTQPTLSNGIAQLEQEFDEKIFSRTTRIVSLTQFGEYILPIINNLLITHTELIHASQNYKKIIQKIIRIGTSPIIHSQWLIPMIESFRKLYPDIQIILHEQNMADLYRLLDEGLIDCVFGVEEIKKNSYKIIPLYQEPLYFIPCSTDIQRATQTVHFSDIMDETFVMVPDICGLATTTRSLFRKHRRKLKEYSGEALSYQVLEEWATLGLGAAILPKSKLQKNRHNAYAIVDKRNDNILISMVMYLPNKQKSIGYINDFIVFLKEYNDKTTLSFELHGEAT